MQCERDREMAGQTVFFLGKLAALNRQEAARMVRDAGGRVATVLGPAVTTLVVGDDSILSQNWNLWNDQLDDATREAFEAGAFEIVSEARFWDKLGGETGEVDRPSKTLYTPAMLAELAGLPLSTVRRLHRLGLIVPTRKIHRLCYFDFECILPLKMVRSMIDAGMSLPKAVDRFCKAKPFLTGQAEVQLDGKDLIFSSPTGTVDQDGQRRFAFSPDDTPSAQPVIEQPDPLAVLETIFHPENDEVPSCETLCESAWALESTGNLTGALDLYRAALTVCSEASAPQLNFQIAELLYRLGDLTAARERYYMAIERDETFVEARANLGCVLAELGCDELAAAALRGALKHHPEYAEVHFHLGMLLRRAGLHGEADHHFQVFLELMPDSPWAERIAT